MIPTYKYIFGSIKGQFNEHKFMLISLWCQIYMTGIADFKIIDVNPLTQTFKNHLYVVLVMSILFHL